MLPQRNKKTIRWRDRARNQILEWEHATIRNLWRRRETRPAGWWLRTWVQLPPEITAVANLSLTSRGPTPGVIRRTVIPQLFHSTVDKLDTHHTHQCRPTHQRASVRPVGTHRGACQKHHEPLWHVKGVVSRNCGAPGVTLVGHATMPMSNATLRWRMDVQTASGELTSVYASVNSKRRSSS